MRCRARIELVSHHSGRHAMPVAQRILLVFARKIGVVIGAMIREAKAHSRVFRLHDAHPIPHRPSGVIQHGANAETPRSAKGMQALARDSMDEIARLQMRARPSVEATVLPEIKPARTGTQLLRRMLEQRIDDSRAKAMSAEGHAHGISQFPRRIPRIIAA